MDGEKIFKTIVSGKDQSLLGDAARYGLGLLSKIYAQAMVRRNHKYDAGQDVYHASVPVISVGNITLGGTGKTPMVRYICQALQKKGAHTAVLSRGYKAKDNSKSLVISRQGHMETSPDVSGDEAWLLAKSLPGTDVIIGRSRSESAQLATSQLGAQYLVLDDGFQHRKLFRDLDLILVDASNPFGYGHVVPRGMLREPLDGLNRAHMIILTKVNQVDLSTLNDVRHQLELLVPDTPVAETIHKPRAIMTLEEWVQGQEGEAPDQLTNQPIMAVSGIGNPESFKMALESLGYDVCHLMPFGDHHNFTGQDLIAIWNQVFAHGAKALVITEKDAVKLSGLKECQDLNIPIYVLSIGIEFTQGESQLLNLLDRL